LSFYSMDLSIIILNYNSKDYLLPCIKGITEHTADLEYEIIVVDNASTDSSINYIERKILPRFSQVKLVKAKTNGGYAAGNNLGIKASSGHYLVIMNPDIVIWDNSLKQMVDFMDAKRAVGIAGPRLLSPDGSLQYACYSWPTPQVLLYRRTVLGRFGFAERAIDKFLLKDWDHLDSRPVDWLQGSCVIVRREALLQVGLMDERYFLYAEDMDWCRRFWQQGWEVWYLAPIELIHYHQRASAKDSVWQSLFNKMSWVHLASSIKYFRKWGLGKTHAFHS